MSDDTMQAVDMQDDDEQEIPPSGSALIEDGDRELYAAAAARFPIEAHKDDVRGGTKITYVPGEDVISRMNHVFVYGWESEILNHGINEDADEVWVQLRITIWRKIQLRSVSIDELSGNDKPTKTITGYTEQLIPIKREQFGSQKLKRSRSSGKVLDIGFDLKGAATDALKKTVSLLGVALYLWNKEELALIAWAKKEMEQEQRQQGKDRQQNDDGPSEGSPQQAPRRFARPNRGGNQEQADSGTTSPPAKTTRAPATDDTNGALVINGVTMPEGFQQPFALLDQGKAQNQCRAEQCAVVIDPNANYAVGNEQKKGGYVMKRAREMAGTILCSSHAAQWHRAQATAKQEAAA